MIYYSNYGQSGGSRDSAINNKIQRRVKQRRIGKVHTAGDGSVQKNGRQSRRRIDKEKSNNSIYIQQGS